MSYIKTEKKIINKPNVHKKRFSTKFWVFNMVIKSKIDKKIFYRFLKKILYTCGIQKSWKCYSLVEKIAFLWYLFVSLMRIVYFQQFYKFFNLFPKRFPISFKKIFLLEFLPLKKIFLKWAITLKFFIKFSNFKKLFNC